MNLFFILGLGLLGTLIWVSLLAMFFVWWERKISAHIQSRVGPMEVGFHGFLQTLADGIKLLLKEESRPTGSDRLLYALAPVLVFVPIFSAFSAIAYSSNMVVVNLNLGLFFFLAFISVEAIGLVLAGWGSNNKWSLLGAMRVTAQIIGEELPMGISLLGIVLLAGSLNMVELSQAQAGGIQNWFWFHSPFTWVAGFVFFVASLAAAKRGPFDLPEAESELVSGFHTEYSGFLFALFFLAEYASMFLFAAIGATAFLGGFSSIFEETWVPGWAWLIGKSFLLVFVMIWVRWTLPRYRIDQVMRLCLKGLLPIAFVCLIGLSVWYTLIPTESFVAQISSWSMLGFTGFLTFIFFYQTIRG